MKRRPTAEEVEREIAALDSLAIASLRSRWREVYGNEPPLKVRRGFMARAVAYRLQELAFGGLKPATQKHLRKLADAQRSDSGETAALRPRPKTLSPGTRLLREWNGTSQIVDVLSAGFGWRGKTYKTLSAVAVAITGTKWSGPKFFGLVAVRNPLIARSDELPPHDIAELVR